MFLTLLVYTAMSVVLIQFARSTRREPAMFQTWKDVRRAWRTSRGWLRIVLVVALLLSIVFRPASVWSAVIAIAGGFIAIVSAFLGWDWLRLLQFIRDAWGDSFGSRDAPPVMPQMPATSMTS